MRHKVAGRELSRTKEHRLALRRNLVASLFEHETISTTIEKAKEVKPFAEKLITLAKKGTLNARRRAISLLGNRDIVGLEDDVEVKKGTVIGKLFSDLGPRYLDRPGGYTRIIRLSLRRLGDNGQLVLLQLVGAEKNIEEPAVTPKKKRSRKVSPAADAQQDSAENEAKKTEKKQESSDSAEIMEAKKEGSKKKQKKDQ
ncbi:MAG: 50S ribosomal protein L17 [Sedimentisphaerales bacterium]|nr:50S ribosomal protein L17 [Sedimentisphaerales bacterium]